MSEDKNQRRTYPFKTKRAVVRMKRSVSRGGLSGLSSRSYFSLCMVFEQKPWAKCFW